jgi:hypothetical protein
MVVILLVVLPEAAGVKVVLDQAAGDLELASGAEADMVVKVTTGPQVSKLQIMIKCFKTKESHIRWV